MAASSGTPAPSFRPAAARALPGIVWPTIDRLDREGVRRLLRLFARSERMTAERLRAAQFRQLRALLRHARETVPFYRETLGGLDLGAPLAPEQWARLPLLTRRAVQAEGEALFSTRCPPEHGRIGTVTTSGSTGTPVTVQRTRLGHTLWLALTARDHLWHRREVAAKLCALRVADDPAAHSAEGRRSRSWGAAAACLGRTGPAVVKDIGRPAGEQLDWLLREDPAYLLTYPSNLRALLREAEARGRRPPGLRQVMTFGELLPADLRAVCRRVWDAEITDSYSNQEHGPIALQCPEAEHYHVQSEAALVEVLDEAGAPCRPGEIGRLVLTPLHAFAMPLVRYETGDYAELGPPCPCGRGLPVLTRIVGRVRNCLRAPGGGTFWPKIGEFFFREVAPIIQYQIVQRRRDRLEANFVIERALTPGEEAELRRRIVARIGYPFAIDFRYVAEIARGPGGKYEDVVCALAEDEA